MWLIKFPLILVIFYVLLYIIAWYLKMLDRFNVVDLEDSYLIFLYIYSFVSIWIFVKLKREFETLEEALDFYPISYLLSLITVTSFLLFIVFSYVFIFFNEIQ